MTARCSEELETKLPELEEQEEELSDAASVFNAAISSGGQRSEVVRALDLLVWHATHHFASEERLMAATDYPWLHAHSAAHVGFIRELTRWKRRVDDDDNNVGVWVLLDLEYRAGTWLTEHRNSFDREFGMFCKPRGMPNSG